MVEQPTGLFRFFSANQRKEFEARMDAFFNEMAGAMFVLRELHHALEDYLRDLLEGEEFR